MNRLFTMCSAFGVSMIVGCAAPAADAHDEVETSAAALTTSDDGTKYTMVDAATAGATGDDAALPDDAQLRGGGCSMTQIHQAQDLCAIFSYPRRSHGIHYCSVESDGGVMFSCA